MTERAVSYTSRAEVRLRWRETHRVAGPPWDALLTAPRDAVRGRLRKPRHPAGRPSRSARARSVRRERTAAARDARPARSRDREAHLESAWRDVRTPVSRGAAERGRPELSSSCFVSGGGAEGQLRLGTRRCRVTRSSLLSIVAKPPSRTSS
jgi:hypothetical protein